MQAIRAISQGEESGGVDKNRGPEKGRGELQGFSWRYLSCSWLTSEKPLAPMPARANRARFCLATSLCACPGLFGRGRGCPTPLVPDRLVVPINASGLVVFGTLPPKVVRVNFPPVACPGTAALWILRHPPRGHRQAHLSTLRPWREKGKIWRPECARRPWSSWPETFANELRLP